MYRRYVEGHCTASLRHIVKNADCERALLDTGRPNISPLSGGTRVDL
jgi:hypothetical protein